ncbi:hypothetical protein LPN04_31355 [Rugamonas sp. A1-17]|nr:hypothetical protein [Rugamonas sp. A1-17]
MKFVFLVAVVAAMFVSMTASYRSGAAANPQRVSNAARQVDQYRIFMFVASQYMATYSGGAGTLYWKDIRNAPGAPSGGANSGMRTDWRIVVSADSTWVACTQMDERAAGILQQLTAPAGLKLNPTKIQNTDYIVVGAATDIPKSALCN